MMTSFKNVLQYKIELFCCLFLQEMQTKETVFLTAFLGKGFTNWKTNQNTHLGFALDAIAAIPQARSILCQSAFFFNNLKYKNKN